MGTKITLLDDRLIHIEGRDGRSRNLAVGDRVPGQKDVAGDQDGPREVVPAKEATPATSPVPGRGPGYPKLPVRTSFAVPGYPKLPVRTSFAVPGYPKAPPHVLIVSGHVDDRGAEVWGNGYRRKRKVLPVSVRWRDLGASSDHELAELLQYTRATKERFTKNVPQVLNVFVSKRDIEQGLDVDEIRAKARQLAPEIYGFNVLFVDKGSRRRK